MKDPLLEVVHGRNNPLIDPVLHVWGWEIPVYLFLGGLVAGILVLSATLELAKPDRSRSTPVRLAPFLSLALLSLGMLALFLDLEHKVHVYRFYLAFKPTSPMSWGSWILVLVYPAALLIGLGSLSDRERERLASFRPLAKLGFDSLLRWAFGQADRWRRHLLWTSILVGAALGVYTGILLGSMVSRPQWNTPVLGPLFLASGVSTGAAFLTLFRLEEHEHHSLIRWDMAAIAIELVLIALMLIGYATGSQAGQHALYHLMGGPWTAAFWSLVVLAGLVVPLTLELLEVRLRLPFTAVTSVLILVGGLSLRFILLAAGQASSFRELY